MGDVGSARYELALLSPSKPLLNKYSLLWLCCITKAHWVMLYFSTKGLAFYTLRDNMAVHFFIVTDVCWSSCLSDMKVVMICRAQIQTLVGELGVRGNSVLSRTCTKYTIIQHKRGGCSVQMWEKCFCQQRNTASKHEGSVTSSIVYMSSALILTSSIYPSFSNMSQFIQ